MKLFISLLFLVSSSAFADDLTCDAHEIMVGNSGRHGTLVMGANPFSLKWNGDTSELIGKGVLCGVDLNTTTVCRTIDTSSGPTSSTRMTCVDKDKSPFENTVGGSYFVFSHINGVGRFGCNNVGGTERVEKVVEINNCR